MSETRKSHVSIDGGQVKEDDHVVGAYKQIPQTDSEVRTKPTLSKSKEKVSDEAEEKLLQEEPVGRITTRVDMADAKYVVGDHRNGDAKIELDANKRQFSGLTKEELMKYADDPFWVRLRWLMFVLFWAMWLAMLGGAIAIIVQAPKCAPPAPKTWYELGPLVDLSSEGSDMTQLEADLPVLQQASVQGVFVRPCEDSYEPIEEPQPAAGCFEKFKAFAAAAKERSIKVIVDLTANFVSTSHSWFKLSENRSEEYDKYFIWAAGTDYDGDVPKVPNNWLSVEDGPAWTYSASRQQYYLHQFGAAQADLNFANPAVVGRFDHVLAKFMEAGAAGVRLVKARQLLVNPLLPDEPRDPAARGATHLEYASLLHKETSDRPELDLLLAHWAHRVAANSTEPTVFTLAEDGHLGVEWHRLDRNSSSLRPPSAAPVTLEENSYMTGVAIAVNNKLGRWPALQLVSPGETEVWALSLMLPAAPVLQRNQIFTSQPNDTASCISHVSGLRADASLQHGQHAVHAVPAAYNDTNFSLIACSRWKSGHTGFVSVYNAGSGPARANLTRLPAVPARLAVHYLTPAVREYTNYTINYSVPTEDVLVPPRSAIILSFVPNTATEE